MLQTAASALHDQSCWLTCIQNIYHRHLLRLRPLTLRLEVVAADPAVMIGARAYDGYGNLLLTNNFMLGI